MFSNLAALSDVFRNGERMGADTDEPEGSRYMLLSHSCACDVADFLDKVRGYLEYIDERERVRLMMAEAKMVPAEKVVEDAGNS